MIADLIAEAPPPADLHVRFASEGAGDGELIDALVADAFGPGRFAKTAERLRETADQRRDLSLCAFAGETLVGAVRLWSVQAGGTPALFLGPIAVRRDRRRFGLGASLVLRACEAARAAGQGAVILVGDARIFESQGFEVAPRGRLILPGPVDPARIMWRGLRPGMLDRLAGEVVGVRHASPPA